MRQKGLSRKEVARLLLRDKLVLEHVPLARAIATRIKGSLPVHVDLDDLVHVGILGLFDAANKFEPAKNVPFSSYAKHRIRGAILDSLRELDWASRDMRRRSKEVEAATHELAAELQRVPTETEVAQKMGVTAQRWRAIMVDLRNVGLISYSSRSEGDDLPVPDFAGKPEDRPDSICLQEEMLAALGLAVKTLPLRYQKLISLYYTADMTMKEIGGVLGINESRVSQMHRLALRKLREALSAVGITSVEPFTAETRAAFGRSATC